MDSYIEFRYIPLEADQRACFKFTNLQPLWAADNLAKGAKWVQPTLAH